MHWCLVFIVTFAYVIVAQCHTAMKVDSVIRTGSGQLITRPLDSDNDFVPILLPDQTSDYLVTGELMPFWPLDGCSRLQSSPYTKTTKDGKVQFDPVIPGSNVIAIMQAGNCSYETKLAMADQAEHVSGVLILNSNDELPPKIDLYFYNTNLSSFLIKQTAGSSLILIADWYRSHKIRSDVANLSTLTLPSVLTHGRAHLPSDSSEQTPLATSATTAQGQEYYDGWLMATFYYLRPDTGGSMFGLVEFSLILVVVLLTVAFLTSIILHCYFYRLRVRRARLGEQGASEGNEELGQGGGRHLLVADQLSFLPKNSYSEFHQARIKLNEESTANSKILTSKGTQEQDTKNRADTASSSSVLEEGAMPKSPSTSKSTRLRADHAVAASIPVPAPAPAPAPATEVGMAPALRASTSQLFISLNDTCPICLEEFENAEELRQLPCHHLYHPLCIDDWLMIKSAKCPMCKFDVYEAIKRMEEAKAQANGTVDNSTALPNARNRMEKMMAWFQSKWGQGRAAGSESGSGLDLNSRSRPVTAIRTTRPRAGSRSSGERTSRGGQEEPASPEQ